MIAIVSIVYSISRAYLNKKYNLNIPIIPERYYDNTQLTIIQAILTMFSFGVAVSILRLISWFIR